MYIPFPAIDRGIEQVPGAVALINGVVYTKYFYILLYGQTDYIVEGTPLIDPSIAQKDTEMPDYLVINMDKDGNVVETKEITKAGYSGAY